MEEQKPRIHDSHGEGEPNSGNPSENFLLIVTAIIRNAEGKILLQKRVDPDIPAADGKWETPGGKIKPGETPEEAIIRECRAAYANFSPRAKNNFSYRPRTIFSPHNSRESVS